MKLFVAIAVTLSSVLAMAEDKIKLYYVNEDVTKIIEHYSKASGQRFVIDSTVRGKITLLNATEMTLPEAFNQISEALAINGFAIIKTGDTMTVRNARAAQRDNLEVYNEQPPIQPTKMATWVISLKHIKAQDVQQQLRLVTSSYGELSPFDQNNQIIISDWTTNLNRVAKMIKELDKPTDPKVLKLVQQNMQSRKDWMKYRKETSKAEAKEESFPVAPKTNN